MIEALCCVIAMEDVENCEDVEDATVNELVESTIRCLRNERGPEGEELSRNVCEKILMHKKIREVGENQLRLLMENRKWQKRKWQNCKDACSLERQRTAPKTAE